MNKLSQSICNINNSNCILLGDFNFPHINWVNKTADSALSQYFLDSVEENMLFQLINKPSRGNNILDQVLLGTLILFTMLKFRNHLVVVITVKHRWNLEFQHHVKDYLYSKGKYDQFNLGK